MAKKRARDRDHLADGFEAGNTGGLTSGFLADEETFDRRALLRLGAWAVTSLSAVVVAVLVNHSSMKWRQDQVAALDLAQQSQQIRSVAKQSQNETRRLASAIDTLNDDRDRLYSRMTVVEQGLDSVTGSISRQNSVAASPPVAAAPTPAPPPPVVQPPAAMTTPSPSPVAAPVATIVPSPSEKPTVEPKPPEPPAAVSTTVDDPATASPATPLMASQSIMAPPDAAAGKLIAPDTSPPQVVAATPPVEDADADATKPDATEPMPTPSAVKRTEFGVDVGGANSVGGLRALWRGLARSKSGAALAALEPIIVVKEGAARGLGLQLRLVAGPLTDAAAAAKICAVMIENKRSCETTVFDGQRLALKGGEDPAAAEVGDKPGAVKPVLRRRNLAKRAAVEQPAPKPETAGLSSFFSRR